MPSVLTSKFQVPVSPVKEVSSHHGMGESPTSSPQVKPARPPGAKLVDPNSLVYDPNSPIGKHV